jgi:hypothetical protein
MHMYYLQYNNCRSGETTRLAIIIVMFISTNVLVRLFGNFLLMSIWCHLVVPHTFFRNNVLQEQ